MSYGVDDVGLLTVGVYRVKLGLATSDNPLRHLIGLSPLFISTQSLQLCVHHTFQTLTYT